MVVDEGRAFSEAKREARGFFKSSSGDLGGMRQFFPCLRKEELVEVCWFFSVERQGATAGCL